MERTISNNLNNKNIEMENALTENIKQDQNNFLTNIFGDGLNNAINLGIKAITPDLIEDQIIEIKDSILKNGLKGGIDSLVENVKEFASSTLGIFKGTFNNLEEMNIAIKQGGILDTTSDAISIGLKHLYSNNKIDKSTYKMIENGKDTIVKEFAKNIENKMDKEMVAVEKIEKLSKKWENALDDRDIEKMTSALNEINKNLKSIVKVEDIIEKAKLIKEHHNWIIENNSFDYKPKI